MIVMIILFLLNSVRTQSQIQAVTCISLDYFTTQDRARFQSQGYPNQVFMKIGVGANINISKRIFVGMNFEYYARREKFDCMYFIGPDDPPMPSLIVFIDNPNYACQFRGDSLIDYLDIPLMIGYDFFKTNTLTLFTSIGIGPQIVLKRTSSYINNQTNEMMHQNSNDKPYVLSNKTSRCKIGIEKIISSKLTLISSIEFKTDEFKFINNTFGINTAIGYAF